MSGAPRSVSGAPTTWSTRSGPAFGRGENAMASQPTAFRPTPTSRGARVTGATPRAPSPGRPGDTASRDSTALTIAAAVSCCGEACKAVFTPATTQKRRASGRERGPTGPATTAEAAATAARHGRSA